ncbi:S-layer homology domain-containing protein, partial [Paenibacillus sepulcri]|nr:S-layer homology domain-containing protein [Paenibacillus sepulcri]
EDIGKKGVDDASGYGLLSVDRAVTASLKTDQYEPNNTRDKAAAFPAGTKIAAEISGNADRDWYRIDAPYDGTMSIQFQGITAGEGSQPSVTMTHYTGDDAQSTKETRLGNETADWKVKKGINYFELQLTDNQNQTVLPYLLTSSFEMSADAYENNDKQYSGFTLSPRSQTIVGNFHQTGDRDWYVVHFETGGTLKLSLTTDSVRIDPSLSIQLKDGPLLEVDENGEGASETSELMSITPGTYYFRVYNAMSAQASPVIGQYTLAMDFRTKYTDPNEPNNKTYEATAISSGSDYTGVIGDAQDVDWYQLRLGAGSVVGLKVSGIPADVRIKAVIMDKRQKIISTLQSKPGETGIAAETKLEAGLYYIKVTASAPFDKQYYGLRIDADQIVAGYRDIAGHWAEGAIVALNTKGIIAGSGAYQFRPDESITRAEAVSMLVRAFKPPKAGAVQYRDVPAKYWAAGAIAQAVTARWASGYPDGTFGPERFITREEMAAMLVKALSLSTVKPLKAPYNDVDMNHWSSASLAALKQKGLIGGYPDQEFKPEQTASRAEFASLLLRALQ